MKWTTEKPTESGCYWYKGGDEEIIVQVVAEEGRLIFLYPGDEQAWPVDSFGERNAVWAGPIPKLEEA